MLSTLGTPKGLLDSGAGPGLASTSSDGSLAEMGTPTASRETLDGSLKVDVSFGIEPVN